jgi:hypothetical protein
LSKVDLPDPFVPIRPIASPRYAVNDTDFTACTVRTPAARPSFFPRRMRLSATVALPRPAPVPFTR